MPATPDRRSFLRTLAAGIAAAAWTSGCASMPTAERIVDTHTHFYDPTRAQGVPWPAKGSFLSRPVLPPDWQRLANPHGIRETVVIEASPWVQDNDWILRLADAHPCIVGCVGNLRPADGTFAGHLRRLAAHPLFRGIRVPAGNLTRDLTDPAFRRSLSLLTDHGLALDINGLGDFAGATQLARAFPDLSIVVDHVGNVRDPHRPDATWRDGMSRLGVEPNVYCKISAVVEQANGSFGSSPTDPNPYRPTLDHVSTTFGSQRIFFGSDWPVSDKGSDFAGMFRVIASYFAERSPAERADFYWRNSLRAYRWVSRG